MGNALASLQYSAGALMATTSNMLRQLRWNLQHSTVVLPARAPDCVSKVVGSVLVESIELAFPHHAVPWTTTLE